MHGQCRELGPTMTEGLAALAAAGDEQMKIHQPITIMDQTPLGHRSAQPNEIMHVCSCGISRRMFSVGLMASILLPPVGVGGMVHIY